jgi:CBS domain-containing membrane protein
LRACLGAALGILATGLLNSACLGSASGAIWLIAPMGASAVLLFGVPASPLAQPWSILGGNVVSAALGAACARWVAPPVLAAALAVGLAIAVMFSLRCLHPPSGAIALTAVIGGAQVHATGFRFLVTPVALNSVALLGIALVFNKATEHRYPHSQLAAAAHPPHTADPIPSERMGFTLEDLQDYNQVLDVSMDDLEDLFRKTERHAFDRRFGKTQCEDLMSRDVLAVDYATELTPAWELMHALPVIDRGRHLVGLVTRADFLRHVQSRQLTGLAQRLGRFLQRSLGQPFRSARGGRADHDE